MLRKPVRRIRNNFLVGLALVTPIGLTILIANGLFVFVTNVFLTEALENSDKQVLYRAAALIIVIGLCFLVGFFTRSFLGRHLYRLGDRLLARLPFVNKIYVQVRHMSEVLLAQRRQLFQKVALFEYPRKGIYSIGFVTSPVPAKMEAHMTTESSTKGFISIFVPTTPNPTSGLMVMVPKADVVFLDIEVADAMKFVVSAGAVHPGDEPNGKRQDLLDKLEDWANHDTNDST